VLVAGTIRTESFSISVLYWSSSCLIGSAFSKVIFAFCHMPTRDHLISLMVPYSSNVAWISYLVVPSGISLIISV